MNDLNNLSVGCVVIRDNRILLVRHTYGNAKKKLLIPGGFLKENELPNEAAERELMEETNIVAKTKELMAVRFDRSCWYSIFLMDYVSGEPKSDNDENSEAIFMDIKEALQRDDITEITKYVINMYLESNGLEFYPEYTKHKGENYLLFGGKR